MLPFDILFQFYFIMDSRLKDISLKTFADILTLLKNETLAILNLNYDFIPTKETTPTVETISIQEILSFSPNGELNICESERLIMEQLKGNGFYKNYYQTDNLLIDDISFLEFQTIKKALPVT